MLDTESTPKIAKFFGLHNVTDSLRVGAQWLATADNINITDTGAIEKIVEDVLAANPKQVEQYKSGKTQVMGFLVGQVMKASRGQANPQAVNEILRRKLDA